MSNQTDHKGESWTGIGRNSSYVNQAILTNLQILFALIKDIYMLIYIYKPTNLSSLDLNNSTFPQ